MRSLGARVKSILPKGLLGRSLLILVTPLIVLQIVSACVIATFAAYVVHDRLTVPQPFTLNGLPPLPTPSSWFEPCPRDHTGALLDGDELIGSHAFEGLAAAIGPLDLQIRC